eukprot:m.126624 g.126624  ORF g.126624 m.126624 type:complete len:863 (+) comp37914_c0_seq2:53-2641(+)
MLVGKRRSVARRIQLSGFDDVKRCQMAKTIKELGGFYIDRQYFDRSSTHVVCDAPSRKEKYLSGCAAGIWVLSPNFLVESQKKKSWADEEKYSWDQITPAVISMKPLYEAACRWRVLPFREWKVVVATETRSKDYKRLLECGGAEVYLKKWDFSLADFVKKKCVNHVFSDLTGVNGGDVGISTDVPILQPEYIVQFLIQNPNMDDFRTFTASSSSFDEMEEDVLQVSQLVLEEEKEEKEEKRSLSLPPAEMPMYFQDSWISLFDFNESVTSSADLPSKAWSIVDGLEEGNKLSTILDVVHSLSYFMPPANVLNKIIKKLLINAMTCDIALKAYVTLRCVLFCHPPWKSLQIRSIYLESLGSAQGVQGLCLSTLTSQAWETISQSMKLLSSSSSYVHVSSNIKFIEFLVSLILQDFDHVIQHSGDDKLKGVSQTLLWQLFWQKQAMPDMNLKIKEFLKIVSEFSQSVNVNPKMGIVTSVLLQLISRIAHCMYLSELSCPLIGQRCMALAWEFTLSIRSLGHKAMTWILRDVQPSWLLLKICQMLLDRYTPMKKINPKNDLEHLMTQHLFLLPEVVRQKETPATPLLSRKRPHMLKEVPINLLGGSPKRKNIEKKNAKGETPLHVACIRGNLKVVREYVELGVNPNSCDNAGWTPLHEVASQGDVQCMKELMKHGTSVKSCSGSRALFLLPKSADGTTPLHDAVLSGSVEAADLLLSCGGNSLLNSMTNTGKSPLDFASTDAMRELLEERSGFGASVEIISEDITSLDAPTPSEYSSFLSEGAVSVDSCAFYAFLVSREFKSYVGHQLMKSSGFSADDESFIRHLSEFLKSFDIHLQTVMKVDKLPDEVSIYLETLKVLASSLV